MNGRARLAVHRPPVRLIALCALIVGCSRDDAAGGVVQHPLAKYWNRPGSAVQIHGPASGGDHAAAPEIVARLNALTPVLGIGAMDGPAERVFGQIADAATDGQGRLVVLDARYHQLRLYDRRGRFIAAAGRPGAGPGEFQAPAALALDGDSAVWVLDRRAARVSRFRFEQGGIRFASSFALQVAADDLCAMEGDVFVYGVALDRHEVIHRYSAAGTPGPSFGVVYSAPNPLVRNQLLMGRLICAEENRVVLAMSNALPEVRAYEPYGALRWRSVIPDHRAIRMDEEPDGVVQGMPAHGRGYHYGASLVSTHSGYAITQIGLVTMSSMRRPNPFAELHTYVIDTRSGRGWHAGTGIPLLAHLRGPEALSASTDPFPRLTVLAAAAGTGR